MIEQDRTIQLHKAYSCLRLFLGLERRAILASRSYAQTTKYSIPEEDVEDLYSSYKDRIGYPLLVAVLGNGKMVIHNDQRAVAPLFLEENDPYLDFDENNAVRGFYFNLDIWGKEFDILELDPGPSRRYYDSMDETRQREFIRTWLEEIPRKGDFTQGFGTFISMNPGTRVFKIQGLEIYKNPLKEKIRLRRIQLRGSYSDPVDDIPEELLDKRVA